MVVSVLKVHKSASIHDTSASIHHKSASIHDKSASVDHKSASIHKKIYINIKYLYLSCDLDLNQIHMFFWPEVILLYKDLNMDIFLTSPSSSLFHIKSTSEICSSAICSSTSELYILHMKKFQKCIGTMIYIYFFL